MSASRFQKGSGCYVCQNCGRRTRATGRGDCENVRVCAECYDRAGVENEHMDGEHKSAPDANCRLCAEERERAGVRGIGAATPPRARGMAGAALSGARLPVGTWVRWSDETGDYEGEVAGSRGGYLLVRLGKPSDLVRSVRRARADSVEVVPRYE